MILGINFANLALIFDILPSKKPFYANLALVFGLGLSKKKVGLGTCKSDIWALIIDFGP